RITKRFDELFRIGGRDATLTFETSSFAPANVPAESASGEGDVSKGEWFAAHRPVFVSLPVVACSNAGGEVTVEGSAVIDGTRSFVVGAAEPSVPELRLALVDEVARILRAGCDTTPLELESIKTALV